MYDKNATVKSHKLQLSVWFIVHKCAKIGKFRFNAQVNRRGEHCSSEKTLCRNGGRPMAAPTMLYDKQIDKLEFIAEERGNTFMHSGF